MWPIWARITVRGILLFFYADQLEAGPGSWADPVDPQPAQLRASADNRAASRWRISSQRYLCPAWCLCLQAVDDV
ncbi:hypothetical protein DMB66_57255 [Actinoplanes sp. ATCC 53533]|nr:hypothetical protein DMB66_57255 [Actinoplanes sp. ATCC 53533]